LKEPAGKETVRERGRRGTLVSLDWRLIHKSMVEVEEEAAIHAMVADVGVEEVAAAMAASAWSLRTSPAVMVAEARGNRHSRP
jgi:hypothetical protein